MSVNNKTNNNNGMEIYSSIEQKVFFIFCKIIRSSVILVLNLVLLIKEHQCQYHCIS